jgi:hypothetical protein
MKIENGYLLIDTGINHFEYDIPLWSLQTQHEKEDWLRHLKEKNWFSEELERKFIKLTKDL